ncbi:MAG: electron transport complex subunit RsxC [Clostridiales bacterium]|jgi:electron transport complex protein RnfC|nr:electron transport complex subunit RsxC [Clostridiales bacterium]
MTAATFKRGIHPPESKNTGGSAIEMIYPDKGEEMIFPVQQHLGAPCKAIVQVGDRVLMGQKIADSDAYVCAPIHSSVSGTVKGMTETVIPTGATVSAIVIENDGLYEESPDIYKWKNNERDGYDKLSRDTVLKIIREAGIVGMGGAGFPAHVKLNPPKDKKIDYIIVNASECEPYLCTDNRVMLEEGERLVSGLRIILRLFDGVKGLIGIETNKPEAMERITKITANDANITVIPLKPKYPQGSEKQLIMACTGRQVPSGGLPADAGCIVNNVDTVVAIDRAVRRGRPLMRRVVTLDGGAVRRPGNYKVLTGMSYDSLVKAAGGLKEPPAKIISGGPMMGVAMFNLNIPVIKTSSALLCLTGKEAELPPERNCIRCGKCVSHCPVGLLPLELNMSALANNDDLFVKNNGLECIECGSCSYVCPAKRHLAQSIRSARRRLLAARKK